MIELAPSSSTSEGPSRCQHFFSFDGTVEPKFPCDSVTWQASQAVTERRLELFVLLKNAVRVASEDAYSFASMQLQNLLSRPEATFQVSPEWQALHACQARLCRPGLSADPVQESGLRTSPGHQLVFIGCLGDHVCGVCSDLRGRLQLPAVPDWQQASAWGLAHQAAELTCGAASAGPSRAAITSQSGRAALAWSVRGWC